MDVWSAFQIDNQRHHLHHHRCVFIAHELGKLWWVRVAVLFPNGQYHEHLQDLIIYDILERSVVCVFGVCVCDGRL